MTSNFSFNGLRVTAFESRRAKEIEKLILYHGGVPRVAPSMREVPLPESGDAVKFAGNLIHGKFDIVILMTGVGTRSLAEAVSKKYPLDEFTKALAKTKVVARGPKPVAALRELGLTPDITVPEPNTWRDVLSTLDTELDVSGKNVAVQEYGIPNEEFIKELRKRGAYVTAVPVYKWDLPEDTKPLREAIKSITAMNEDISLFTSSQQIYNLFKVASEEGLEDRLKEGFKDVVIGSIGPTTTEAIARFGLTADYEPDSPKMGNLIREMARSGSELLRKKRTAHKNGVDTNSWHRVRMVWNGYKDHTSKDVTYNSAFMKACRREKTDFTPVWLMRQAGRFMREYRELRAKVTFLDLCKTPELAAEVTLSAVDRLGVDAAIIFSDILLIIEPLGIELEFSKGEGPRILRPVRSGNAVDRVREFDPETMGFVYEAVGITRRALDPEKALIGFAGAPFTVASYMIEGGGSRNYENTKQLMYRDPGAWHALMEKLTDATGKYLNRQIASGADAVQLFDSWVGCLSPDDYREYVLPHMRKLIGSIEKGVPVINFGTGTSTLLGMMKECGSSVIGFDWRVDLASAWKSVGYDVAVQGNLDPVVLYAGHVEIRKRAEEILDKASGRPGHIFNLGHGILPRTPVDNVLALVDAVHEYSAGK
ncbi:MAG: uroporphyrinogen decarboxylase [Thermodesulfobacteriota bacterium]